MASRFGDPVDPGTPSPGQQSRFGDPLEDSTQQPIFPLVGAPTPSEFKTPAQIRQDWVDAGLLPAQEPSFGSMLGSMAMAPLKGLAGIPAALHSYVTSGLPPGQSYPGLESVPGLDALNLAAASVGSELRSPITLGPGRWVQPAPSMAVSALEHILPAPLSTAIRLLRGGAESEPVPAGFLRRLQFQNPLQPLVRNPPGWTGMPPAPEPAPPREIQPIPAAPGARRVSQAEMQARAAAQQPEPLVANPPWRSLPAPIRVEQPEIQPIQAPAGARRTPPGAVRPEIRLPTSEELGLGVPTPVTQEGTTIPTTPEGTSVAQPGQQLVPISEIDTLDKANRAVHARLQNMTISNLIGKGAKAGEKAPGKFTQALVDVHPEDFKGKAYGDLTLPEMQKFITYLEDPATIQAGVKLFNSRH